MIVPSNFQDSPTAFEPAQVLEMGQGEVSIIFLHGLFGTPQHWHPIMTKLADRYRVIAPQLPVDRQPGRRTMGIRDVDDLGQCVDQLIDDFGLEQFVICGNSLGGLLAIDFCLRHPGRASALVLAGSAGLYQRGIASRIRPRPTRAFVRRVAGDILHDERHVTDQLVDEWHQSLLDRDYVRFVLRIARATRDRTVKEELAKLKLPTLIIWGQNDAVTPPSVAKTFQSRITDAELKFIDNCGHAPNLEQPEEFGRVLQEFLSHRFPNDTTEPVRKRSPSYRINTSVAK